MSKKPIMRSLSKCTYEELLRMPRDNINLPEGWALIGADSDTITIAQQKTGENAEAMVTLSRASMRKLCRFFMRQYRVKP